jgi:hypothetical protein
MPLSLSSYQMMFTRIVSVATGKVLGVPGGAPEYEGAIQQFTYDGSTSQQWLYKTRNLTEDIVTEVSTFTSRATGKVLDVMESATDNHTPVIQWTPYHNQRNQMWWAPLSESDGSVVIASCLGHRPTRDQLGRIDHHPGEKVIDVPGGQPTGRIQIFDFNGGANQHWRLEPAEAIAVVKIVARVSDKVLDVPGFSPNPVQVQQYEFNQGRWQTNQLWQVIPVEGEFVKIVSVSSGLVLDVPGGSSEDYIPIQQHRYNGGHNQHWLLAPVEDNYFRIISRATGKVLDVPESSEESGVGIIQFTSQPRQHNQQWALIHPSA